MMAGSDIGEFIARYGKPYDPETDSYEKPPFQKSFEAASKSSKIYNMHMYWTKQDPYVVREFIEHYTEPGDIVLDSMCGTGMTGVAAMLCRQERPDGNMGPDGSAPRHAILLDISPACIHIARSYTSPIDPRELEQAQAEVIAKVQPDIRPLYKTRCHNCGYEDAQIGNTVLSDVYACPRCGTAVLFAAGGRWESMQHGHKVKSLVCGRCGKEFRKDDAAFLRMEPIEIRVECPVCTTKGEGKAKPLDDDDWRRYIDLEGATSFTSELGNQILEQVRTERALREIPAREPHHWYPREVQFFGDEPTRNYKRGITHPYQMFSRRNLTSLATLWHAIGELPDSRSREHLRFAFTGILFLSSLQSRWRYSGGGISGTIGMRTGTLYIPSLIRDMNVINLYRNRCKRLITMTVPGADRPAVMCSTASALELPMIADVSIDYLFYDPPYGSNINYSELNIVWEAWLGSLTQTDEEIIESRYQQKDREDYEHMMSDALLEAFRVLKPGRWLTMVYSYADPSMYRSIQRAAHNAGFVDEGEPLHVNSVSKTKSQLDSDKTQQRFLVINFLKPKGDHRRWLPSTEDMDYRVIMAVKEFLEKTGGHTRDAIYDQVIKRLFTTVQIEQFDLDQLLDGFFRRVGNRWYAPGMLLRRTVKADRTGQIKMELERVEDPEEETVVRLQEFLAKHGTVPLAELREYYLREIAWLDRLPEDFLEQTVEGQFVEEKGRVRLPTLEEQARMQDLQARYLSRRVRRYIDGSLDRPSDHTLCDWIEFCYQQQLYQEGARLFQDLREGSVPQDLYAKARKIANACRMHLETMEVERDIH